MIKTIRLLLEYHAYPVWLYDEDGDVIDTLLPEELRNDLELDRKFDEIQEEFDSLFIDNKHEFSYVGFSSEEQKEKFFNKLNLAVDELRKKINGKYQIKNNVNFDNLYVEK